MQQGFFTQIDVNTNLNSISSLQIRGEGGELRSVLREMLHCQVRQNELLEELVDQIASPQRKRAVELAVWKGANPHLAHFCKKAATKLEQLHTDYLSQITDEIQENFDSFLDSEYMLGEFVDRFGPRFANLSNLLHVLAQLGNAPDLIHPAEATYKQ